MSRGERSAGAFVAGLVTLGLLATAMLVPWFSYDFSSGRQTAPEGPYADVEVVERRSLDFYPFGYDGDASPSDTARADDAVFAIGIAVLGAAAAVLLAMLGDLRGLDRLITRRISLALQFLALAAIVAALTIAWLWLPESMSGHGIEGPFTAFLEEPDGYTRSTMAWGWGAAVFSCGTLIAAGLWKFQAGSYDPAQVEVYRAA